VIHLSEELESEIRAHAARDYPYECCGALMGRLVDGRKIVEEVRPIDNTHADGHERRFEISAEVMFKLDREERAGGRKVLGFYHSHPDHPARPSQYDRDHAANWYSYIIVSSMTGDTGRLTSWVADDQAPVFRAETIEPWTARRAADLEAVLLALSDEDRARCLPIAEEV
jgi:proteasome lid subunit RPN8/RPN11